MKQLMLLSTLVGLAAGCPAPVEIENVDGLGGGTLTSKLVAPEIGVDGALTSGSISTGSLTANSIAATNLTSSVTSAGALTATSATVDSLAVSSAVTALTVGDLTTTTTSSETTVTKRLARNGRVFFGEPVGAVSSESGTTPAADDACATAFPAATDVPAAHLCTEQEIALASASFIPSALQELDGASYSVFSSAQVTTEAGRPVRVDNCQSWTSLPVNPDPQVVTDDVTATDYVSAKTAIKVRNTAPEGVAELLVLTPSWSFDCRTAARKFACCQ